MSLASITPAGGFAALRARDAGLLPAGLSEMGVLLVGAGSVGSALADGLVRGGVGQLTIIDPDTVGAENLSRTLYRFEDIGAPKSTALVKHMRAINPEARVAGHVTTLQGMNKRTLKAVLAEADLIIGATDDPEAQQLQNRISQHQKKPALFVGLYRGAKGGEAVISVPGFTPCLECYAGAARFSGAGIGQVARERDYGTRRLKAEPGLASDIRLVSAASVKIALSLLAAQKRDAASSGGQFITKALEQKLSVAAFGMEPDYWLFPQLMTDVAGQYAFQSVWLTVERNPDCPACGEKRYQDDPIAAMRAAVDANAIRAELGV